MAQTCMEKSCLGVGETKLYSLLPPFNFISVARLARGWRSLEAASHYQVAIFGIMKHILEISSEWHV